MKKLKQFIKFDAETFLKDKKLAVKSIKPTYEYINGVRSEVSSGTTIAVTILVDNTDYGDEVGLNVFESFNLKISASPEGIKQRLKIGQEIKFKDFENLTGTVFGEFQNQLSLTHKGASIPFVTVKANV